MTTPTPEDPQAQQPPAFPPPPPGNPPAYQQPSQLMAPDQERLWAGAAHWGCVVASFVALAFLAPLIIMLVLGPKSAFVRRHAVESLNFQISMLIYGIVSAVLVLVIIGIVLLIGLAILWLVCVITASVKASNGEEYRYPLTIRFVS